MSVGGSVLEPFKSIRVYVLCLWERITKSVTDGISRLHLDKYYFPLLKVSALLFQVFI